MATVRTTVTFENYVGHHDNLPGKQQVIENFVLLLPKALKVLKDESVVTSANPYYYAITSIEVTY